ncbi:MAG: peptidoglycan recognition family protein [Phycisphaeraceae bacterium]
MHRLDRRYFLWTSGLFIAGCQASGGSGSLPDVAWPDVGGRPKPGSGPYVPDSTPTRTPSAGALGNGSAQSPYKRAAWTRSQPRQSNINRIGRIQRITLHHDGFPEPFTRTGKADSAARLELIRTSHTNRGWADIGYHYVVDRGGRVWEARPLSYQGAHVRDHNENNIGILMVGNFDLQLPSDPQLASMQQIVQILSRRHNVAASRIHTHRELGPTSCPGKNLHPRITAMRSNRQFT